MTLEGANKAASFNYLCLVLLILLHNESLVQCVRKGEGQILMRDTFRPVATHCTEQITILAYVYNCNVLTKANQIDGPEVPAEEMKLVTRSFKASNERHKIASPS